MATKAPKTAQPKAALPKPATQPAPKAKKSRKPKRDKNAVGDTNNAGDKTRAELIRKNHPGVKVPAALSKKEFKKLQKQLK